MPRHERGSIKSLRELSSGRSGVRMLETLLTLDAGWLARPQKERRSVRVVGVGKFAIAAMMSALTEYPCCVSCIPANRTFV